MHVHGQGGEACSNEGDVEYHYESALGQRGGARDGDRLRVGWGKLREW
eukprot:CAMPEP_0181196244 /NCGR_PEP_ID=MMETSP1096-20121128/15351_1 /TAXON_ID=156174 ORGANISM="Chrysochromulina ericina, Strain CCMP281" /NCGR_SAMPLE_ID=MMETSP1096 /ASSEMBLY_ACC=CAM_ASM_000453 /LENGTH=47 /DNA_ID= /DNA_START= /DNA_END= /DNA_ORIENTATION=